MHEQYSDQVLGVGRGERVIINVFFKGIFFEAKVVINHLKKYLIILLIFWLHNANKVYE
jgi:hypothetical protein